MKYDDDHDFSTFLKLFKGREDYFAQQGKDYYHPIKRSLNEYYLARHCNGDATFGIYLLTKESYCHLLCFDIDIPKAELENFDITDSQKKYDRLALHLNLLLDVLINIYKLPHESLLIEDTGGRGYHIWIFLSHAILGTIAVAFGEAVKKQVEFDFEFFPKQGRLTPKRKYGNLIKLPLGVHRKYQEMSKFFTISLDKPIFFDDLNANLDLLNKIVPVNSLVISTVAEPLQGEMLIGDELLRDTIRERQRYHYSGTPSILISHCVAMKNLSNKAESGTPLDRREAFHYANVVLSVSGGVNEIHRLMQMSLGQKYNPEKTNSEIENILSLRPTSCKILLDNKICPEYCRVSVKKQNEDPLKPNTTPCSVWLKREKIKTVEFPQGIRGLIGTKENVEVAFDQLKRYYDQEVTIFFDRFDFDLFQRRLDEYSQVIAEALTQQIELPFSGYLPFLLPKRLNDKLELQYRRMSYSSVYDQVPIQAVFTILGPIIDSKFHKSSYGYRWNKDNTMPYRIFEDWRDYYPRCRDDIIASLQENPKGYHICCDIKGYYDNVSHDILLQQLHNAINDEYIYKLVERIVLAYEFDQGTHKGIPQGPAYARLLANLYLNDFDFFISRFSAGYFRYVDDFVLVFNSVKNAESGLNRITKQLQKLGLELSQDGEKKPTIMPNTDLTRVRNTLDKIRYGILENTKHIQRLDTKTINDFYEAVERHSVTFEKPDQLIKINDVLLSLLYVVTQEALIPHPLKLKLIAISEYLIRKHWFFPKKVGSVFGRLLEIDSNKNKYIELFDFMESSHKCYFLLTLFNGLSIHDTYKHLLVDILRKSIVDDDQFVCGLSIAIANNANLSKEIHFESNSILDRLLCSKSWFETVRYLGGTNYLSLTWDEKTKLRKIVDNSRPEIIKSLLLENLSEIPSIYNDEYYLKSFVSEFRANLLPAVTSLLGLANNRSEFIYSLINFLTSEPKFKALSISFISRSLSARCSTAGLAEIENLRTVYEDITDPELKKAVFRVLNQNIDVYEDEFYKTHRLLLNENRCFFFEHLENTQEYSHMELIPEEILKEQLNSDVSSVKRVVEYLSQIGTIPPLDFFYDSGKHEIRLNYKSGNKYKELLKSEFNIDDKKSVVRALNLAVDAYKKALFFWRTFGKTPLISIDNFFVDINKDIIVFRTIGRSLQSPIIISDNTFGEGEYDIPYMIALLIRELLFDSKNHFIDFVQKKPKSPLLAFVVQMIQNMSSKEPSHRYSSLRYEYLVDGINHAVDLSDNHLGVFYVRERLRSALFRYNQEKVTWHGICSALDEHATHLQDICTSNGMQNLRIKNRLFASSLARSKPHYLSRHFVNISLNRLIIQKATINEPSYGDLLEYLLLLSVSCLEITSLCRSLYNRKTPDRENLVSSLSDDWVYVQSAEYKVEISRADLIEISLYNPDETGIDMREISLRKIALLTLLSLGSSFSNGILTIPTPNGIKESLFDDFSHTCLYRIPRMEQELQKCVEDLANALLHNDEPILNIKISDIQENINIIIKNFSEIRSKVGVRRYYGYADGRKFPEKIVCSSPLHRIKIAKVNTLPGIKLTNNFPSSRYECSWDVRFGNVTNLIIPSVGINTLLTDMLKGKLFGHKLSYLYSGKMMIIWDMLIFLCIIIFMSLCKYGEGVLVSSYMQALCSSGVALFSGISRIFLLKLIYDLAFWIPPLGRIITTIRKAWSHYQQGEE